MPRSQPTTITKIRNDRGWTGPTAARRAGIDPATLHRVETGERRLLVSHLRGMIAGWRLTDDELRALVDHYGERDSLNRAGATA